MPFKSEAQRKWAHTKEGTKALGGKKAVEEWERATKGKLPKYAKKKQRGDKVAREDNLIPGGHKLTLDEQKMGGIASGEARRQKATMKKTLEMMLEETHKNGKTYKDNVTLGLIVGAMKGNAQNYKTIVEMLGELQPSEEEQPTLKIEIVDNEKIIKGEENE